MEGALERVLRLVEEGRLTAEEAGPILDALYARATADAPGAGTDAPNPGSTGSAGERRQATTARVEVRERGRKVVDLRVPVSLGRLGLHRIPGLSREQVRDVEAGIASGRSGPILDLEDADGDGVRIVLE